MADTSFRTSTALIPAGHEDLCLAYANTLSWRGSGTPAESLHGFADLLGWLVGFAGLAPEIAEAAGGWAGDEPGAAAALFAEAIGLREAIYRIFAAAAGGERAAETDLVLLNRALAAAPPRVRLTWGKGGYLWAADGCSLSIPVFLAPVMWSAADLLTRADPTRLRRCANEQCLWLFIDRSKTGTRRWCDMSSCGNRAKSRRHYLRTKLS
ncbi:MAG: CGNR zinc finger domain-containing protein [Stellaceae bacterium]